MIINANLQVISWPARKKPLTKAILTITKTLLKENCSNGDNDNNDPNGQPFQ